MAKMAKPTGERLDKKVMAMDAWTQSVIDRLEKGILVDPSLLAHQARGEFLASLRRGPLGLGPLVVPFPVAHIWAIARTDPGTVERYLFSSQEQLPLFKPQSNPTSMKAVADWIRREPWIHGQTGAKSLRKSLVCLADLGWDFSVTEVGSDSTTAADLAHSLRDLVQKDGIPLLTFSDVYRTAVHARGGQILTAPRALGDKLFLGLGFLSVGTPRLVIPASVLGPVNPPVISTLLGDTQILFRAL